MRNFCAGCGKFEEIVIFDIFNGLRHWPFCEGCKRLAYNWDPIPVICNACGAFFNKRIGIQNKFTRHGFCKCGCSTHTYPTSTSKIVNLYTACTVLVNGKPIVESPIVEIPIEESIWRLQINERTLLLLRPRTEGGMVKKMS